MSGFVTPEVAATRYAHGTYARYSLAKCRCFSCKVANADYVQSIADARRLPYRVRFIPETRQWFVQEIATRRSVLRAPDRAACLQLNKRFQPVDGRERISAEKARKHIASLRPSLGTRAIAERAGVSRSCVQKIVSGEFLAIRRDTSDAILGVAASPESGTRVEAGPTWKLIDEILATGKSQAWIAQQLGAKRPALQVGRITVRKSTADRVRDLHGRVFSPTSVAPPSKIVVAPRPKPFRHRDPEIAARWDRLRLA